MPQWVDPAPGVAAQKQLSQGGGGLLGTVLGGVLGAVAGLATGGPLGGIIGFTGAITNSVTDDPTVKAAMGMATQYLGGKIADDNIQKAAGDYLSQGAAELPDVPGGLTPLPGAVTPRRIRITGGYGA
jgi:predicted lipid-binding transport protein (Tim44 family)